MRRNAKRSSWEAPASILFITGTNLVVTFLLMPERLESTRLFIGRIPSGYLTRRLVLHRSGLRAVIRKVEDRRSVTSMLSTSFVPVHKENT
ncbi:MAG: hypothetical protein K9L75_05225 [Spirochaetia bacterium]|nr:hypothetical protein [Spirochaetia bacterium]